MKSISEVAQLTGISTRTLQYYDKIDLLKPTKLTNSGYHMYNDEALEKLQQILFFKELDFKLKEIKEILQKPEFDRIKTYQKQKELLLLKRDHINQLIELLSKLEKGQQCMSFKEFDFSEYIEALETFKNNNIDDIIKLWGSIDNFSQFIQTVKEDETKIAQLAIKQFGSIKKYTNAMKYNLKHFPNLMKEQQKLSLNIDNLLHKNNELYLSLTSDLNKDFTSNEIQNIVHEIVIFTQEKLLSLEVGEGYWDMVIESYSNDLAKEITDKKYGTGASNYIANSFQYYFHKELLQN